MNLTEQFYENIKDEEIIIPKLIDFDIEDFHGDNLFDAPSDFAPKLPGFSTSEISFDNECWEINGFQLITAQTNYKRYIKYTEKKINKRFLWFPYTVTEYDSDLEEIENLIKGYKYDIKFHPQVYVYFSWVSFYILKDFEIEEIDRKGHLEILRRIHRTKVNQLKMKNIKRINKFLK